MKTASILAIFQANERATADLTKRPAPPKRQPADIAMCDKIVKALLKWQVGKQDKPKS